MTSLLSDDKLLFAALENVREAVLITDSELDLPGPAIVYANPAFCEMTGYAIEELVGQTPRLLQGPETDHMVLQTLRRKLSAGEEFFGETVNYRKDGSPFTLEWTIRPYPTAGKPHYYIACQRDVSALRNLEEQCKQLHTLADIQSRVGTAGLELSALRDQVVEVALSVTRAEGAVIEEVVNGDMVYTAVCGCAETSLGLRLSIENSLSGLCYRLRESIHCPDTHIDSRVDREAADRIGFRSGILVPLNHQESCFGVLKVYSDRPRAFSGGDLQLLNMASQVLASSLANARLFRGEQDRHSILEDSLPILISYIDDQLRFREINTAYTRWFNCSRDQIVGKSVSDFLSRSTFERIWPFMQRALAGEQVTFESRYSNLDGTVVPMEEEYIPVRDAEGDLQGFFAMVRDISDRKRAEQDYLTDTLNRKGFDHRLEMACATSRRYARPLSLIFLDLDYFKAINDQFGHAAGDDVLRGVAQTLLEHVRDSEVVCRWGGEEFAILAPETTMEDALLLAERLRQALSNRQYPDVGSITASFGVAEFDVNEADNDFVYRVDQALYVAKAAGRNQIKKAP
jgi:diguanylate cyclase (GGDEF)-like protein/PAS domain S-box-containing protein